jgi:hypothetical protein
MRSLSVDATRSDPHDVRGSDSRNNQQSDLTLTASDKGTRGTPHERWELDALYGDLGGTVDRSGWV